MKAHLPSRALFQLKAQHDALRAMMDRCEELATALDAHVARLRLEFEAHNEYEEALLRPVLVGSDAFADVRIGRMVEDHVGEHRAMHAQLGATGTSGLRDAIEMLRAHMDAEERYLLNPKVLRDDLVTLEDGG